MSRRRDGCRGKRRYTSQTAAVRALIRLGNAGLGSYPCRVCGGWHVGNSRRDDKVQARISQLLSAPAHAR